MHRRRFLTFASAGLLGGCVGSGGGGSGTGTEEQPTDSSTTSAPTETTHEDELTSIPPTETRSLSEGPELESILPPVGDGWELTETRIFGYSFLGGKDAREGIYEAENGVTHHVVVFVAKEDDVDIKASQFKCAGWPVLAVRENYVIAAGNGTYPATLTPEHPRMLDTTPIPEKVDRTRELVLQSAYIDQSHIATEEIECNRVTSSRTE